MKVSHCDWECGLKVYNSTETKENVTTMTFYSWQTLALKEILFSKGELIMYAIHSCKFTGTCEREIY